MSTKIKIIVERHPNVYIAYPLGLKGIVVGERDSLEAAVADVRSAIQFHIETFGADVLISDSLVPDAAVMDADLTA